MEVRRAKKQPLPDWYLAEPIIHPWDEFYITAFHRLSTGRDFAEMSPISWKDIVYYAEYHGLDEDLVPYFYTIIRKLDEAYRDFHKKNEKPSEEDKESKRAEKRARRKRQR